MVLPPALIACAGVWQVIKNGQMLGVHELSSRNFVSSGSAAKASMAVLGEVALTNFFNDGNRGTGTQEVRGAALARRGRPALLRAESSVAWGRRAPRGHIALRGQGRVQRGPPAGGSSPVRSSRAAG